MEYRNFTRRHIGPNEHYANEMLNYLGYDDINRLVKDTVPENILMDKPLGIGKGMSEYAYSKHITALAEKNKVYRSFIGMGYYNTVTPAVIKRNVFENPGWYTAYTPYQAEIAQGRLEAMLNFQTMVIDLTGLEIANASLLDEATAAGEAMQMFYHLRSRKAAKAGVNKFFVDNDIFPQTKSVIESRAKAWNIELVYGDYRQFEGDEMFFGAIVQYPTADGHVHDYKAFVAKLKENDIKVAVIADILALTLLEEPGKWGVDCVVGNTQRFGVPMGFGGPHAAYFASKEEYKRSMPGRIIGVSVDADGNPGYRMALQTREQHIKREKATSNICTAQALLAVMAGFYAVYHGPDGLIKTAQAIHTNTARLYNLLKELGIKPLNDTFFDTLTVEVDDNTKEKIRTEALKREINFFYFDKGFKVSLDETASEEDMQDIFDIFRSALNNASAKESADGTFIPAGLKRTSEFLTNPVFRMYHSETEMMRYLKKLENRDLSLTHSMISLGSCTMKLNAASEMIPLGHPGFMSIHPFAPEDQVQGYKELIEELGNDLMKITGFTGISFEPNSGAQGEYTGLKVIKAYHEDRGEHHRDVCLIPSSAHGTNPASAVMAGMKVVIVKSEDNGNIDVADLKVKAEEHKDNLAALMITYPSTHGVFETAIREIVDTIHENGGLVYMDGANMNAQVGLTSPGHIGADVCHLNLHKTFAIPHGGGGPGMGPIAVNDKLKPYLPGHPLVKTGGEKAIEAVSAAPYGSALILPISYGYIKMLGDEGLKKSTEIAILNANYMRKRLAEKYDILYTGANGTVAHEMIVDFRKFKSAHIEVEDIAKRLMDYGYHAPTVSFPVPGTLMIEPTESESKQEIDRFVDALLQIHDEIMEVVDGKADPQENVLKNAPHTIRMIADDNWDKPYSRQKAGYPADYLYDAKFWPHVRRIDNAYGDRNLVCSCLPIEAYEGEFPKINI